MSDDKNPEKEKTKKEDERKKILYNINNIIEKDIYELFFPKKQKSKSISNSSLSE